MSQTRFNKVVTITNDEVYDLATHQARLADSAKVVIDVASQSERDGLAAKAPGGVLPIPTYVCRTDSIDKRIETWDGTSWINGKAFLYTPVWTGATNWGSGGAMQGWYWVNGDLVTVRAKVTSGTGASLGTNIIGFPLPSGLPIANGQNVLGIGAVGGVLRQLLCFASGTTSCSVWAPTNPVQTPGTAGYPFNAGDWMEAWITYQTTVV